MNVKPMQPLLQGYHRTSRALGIPQNIPNKQQGYQSHNTKYSAYPNKLELKRASADGDIESCDINSGEMLFHAGCWVPFELSVSISIHNINPIFNVLNI